MHKITNSWIFLTKIICLQRNRISKLDRFYTCSFESNEHIATSNLIGNCFSAKKVESTVAWNVRFIHTRLIQDYQLEVTVTLCDKIFISLARSIYVYEMSISNTIRRHINIGGENRVQYFTKTLPLERVSIPATNRITTSRLYFHKAFRASIPLLHPSAFPIFQSAQQRRSHKKMTLLFHFALRVFDIFIIIIEQHPR